MSSTTIIIFSGYNLRAIIAFVRTLEQYGVSYVIVAADDHDPILKTIYKERVSSVREQKALDMSHVLSHIQKAKKRYPAQNYLIAPSTEFLNRFLLRHSKELSLNAVEVPLVDDALYAEISDKDAFVSLCALSGITVPGVYEGISQKNIPYVAKPWKYSTENGDIFTPVLVRSIDEHHAFLMTHREEDFFYQEYIDGESLYLLYYFDKDGGVFAASQKNLVQQAGGKSMIAGITSDFHKSDESQKFIDLFRSRGFRGLVMIEMIKVGDVYYMIEANPRFWGPSQLFVDAKQNLFHAFLYDYEVTKEIPDFSQSRQMRYFWGGGLQQEIDQQHEIRYHDYTQEKFECDKKLWVQSDIYNRPDTDVIFRENL